MTDRSLFRVLVLGGYGNFGRIIVQRLAKIAGIQVLVAGRDEQRARQLAQEVAGEAIKLDMHQPDLAARLTVLRVNLLISTAGPFQGQDYRVALAAIAAQVHYIDLADARQFVCGIRELHAAALQAEILVCSGASSVPALSAAVIDQLQVHFQRIDSIQHGISSSAKIPGIATLQAVLGYCGKPIAQWQQGRWQEVYGWQGLRRHEFPQPLGRRWLVNCDVPDLQLFVERYPGVREVCFGAGLGLRLTHFGAWALAGLVRARLCRNAASLSKLLHPLATALEPLGDGRSGMFVRLQGIGQSGRPLALCWELIALNDQGPNIPCMAAVALARKLAAGHLQTRGAMPCMGLVTAEEYLAELGELSTYHGLREVPVID